MTRTATPRTPLPVLGRPTSAGRTRTGGAPVAEADASGAALRVGLITLGCDKNTVDSERVMGALIGAGAEVASGAEGAEVIVVNSCGFIDVAKEESIETILEAARMKQEGGVRAVVAVGCLVQRYRAELEAELPEVDLFLGLTDMDRLVPELRARGLLPPARPVPTMERPLRVLSTRTPHTSHLKISEGCDHACAFCAIPLMRGKHRSTPIERLVTEARELERQGVVELNIVSQDTTWYGRDWVRAAAAGRSGGANGGGGNGTASALEEDFFIGRPFAGMSGVEGPNRPAGPSLPPGLDAAALPRRGLLPELLGSLIERTGIPWLRLFYMYPSGITRELVELIAAQPRILPYLDMPIQHGSDRMLERMRRPERRSTIRERVGWLRASIPDLTLRTTLIVGFPGESEEDFEDMLELLEEIRFDYLGAFPYSREEGTPAASMPDPVPAEVARERLERLLDLQRAITHERNQARVGSQASVLVDTAADPAAGAYAVGRTGGQAFEVDGVTFLRGPAGPPPAETPPGERHSGEPHPAGPRPGEIVRARIVEAQEHDLVAEVMAP